MPWIACDVRLVGTTENQGVHLKLHSSAEEGPEKASLKAKLDILEGSAKS